ncbi:hypothetical protein WP50_26550 [Lactiplantibacillus plantarum]|nr:hypothetical protein WP50_26550 [Lactiplantibacillus plantarum]
MQEPLVYRRILLTVDEDDNTSSERAFRYATTLAHDYDVPLGICSVLESEDINIFDSLTPSKIQAKRKHVEDVVADKQHYGHYLILQHAIGREDYYVNWLKQTLKALPE